MKNLMATLGSVIAILGLSSHTRAADAAPGSAPSEKGHAPRLVEVNEAEKLISGKKVVVLDVRTPEEFADGHIAGATNLNFHAPDFEKHLQQLDKDQSYLVHCAAGVRSAKASSLMSKLKFQSVYDLKGGLKAWEKAGKPVTKE